MATGTRSRGSAPPDGPVGTEHRVPTSETEALASVEGAEPCALPSPRGMARGLFSVFARPRPLAREVARLGRDSARILRGTDDISPVPEGQALRRPGVVGQSRRTGGSPRATWRRAQRCRRLVDDYEAGGADWREVEQARFVTERARQRDGAHQHPARQPGRAQARLRHRRTQPRPRAGNMITDLARNGGMPTQVDRSAFTVGTDLGGHARRGRPSRGGHRAHPVLARHADRPRTPAGDRPAAHRPLLLPRPPPRAQFRRVRRGPRLPGLPHQLAQPDEEAGRLGPGHLRGAASTRPSTSPATSPAPPT